LIKSSPVDAFANQFFIFLIRQMCADDFKGDFLPGPVTASQRHGVDRIKGKMRRWKEKENVG